MSNFCINKNIVTRKEHRCNYCNSIIPKKTKVLYQSGMWDEEWYKIYLCDFCNKLYNVVDYESGTFHDVFDFELRYIKCSCGEKYLRPILNNIEKKSITFKCYECDQYYDFPWEYVLEYLKE